MKTFVKQALETIILIYEYDYCESEIKVIKCVPNKLIEINFEYDFCTVIFVATRILVKHCSLYHSRKLYLATRAV